VVASYGEVVRPTRLRIGGSTGVICQSSCYHDERVRCACGDAAV
jgi:hypothetical protein